MSSKTIQWLRIAPFVAAIAVSLGVVTPSHAADNPYEKGPNPTEASVTAEKGSFAIAQAPAPSGASNKFNKGTVYYPTATDQGTFGAVAVAPGFTNPESIISWLGPRLASQGFVVITLETNTTLDLPESRGEQLLGAIDWLTTQSQYKDRIDPTRTAVVGFSMGGGGALRAAEDRPALKAAVGLAPWEPYSALQKVTTPTLLIGAADDVIAPTGAHAEPFYDHLTNARDKAYLEYNSGNHFKPVEANATNTKSTLSWLKRFVDNDTRYDQFLCPGPSKSAEFQEYRNTCPLG
ncbi:dienelactone hydrolase family protein [Nocardia sp. NPDC059195]|uniref:dienelactone hydrolase family protein n=1 Tax=Nocardia sp. NPDC059195 TaxID=3346765 RepID=UPI0036A69F9E